MDENVDRSTGETFNDVLFVPQYSDIESRSNISTTTNMGKFLLDLPLVSANMKDITGPKMAITMALNGGLGLMHRFGTIEDSVADYHEAVDLADKAELLTVSQTPKWMTMKYAFGVSVGVKEYEISRFKALYNEGASLFVVDVAHGHHILVQRMIKFMRDYAGDDICIIAGNVATADAAKNLREWGADIIKVGIGPGSRCETRKNTGVGVGQLKAIRSIRRDNPDMVIISDGGIKNPGDIPKALKYANAVMVGSFIAGTSETPGHVYQSENGEFYKVYGGSASGERKVANGNPNSFVEGVVKPVVFRGKAKFILQKAKDCIQSSMSYSGAINLDTFRKKAILEDIGSGVKSESKI